MRAHPNLPLEKGRVYHIYNRGVDKTNLFLTEEHYFHFLRLYQKYAFPIFHTYAYCLLRNHFHFMVRVRETLPTFGMLYPEKPLNEKSALEARPEKQLSNLFSAYTQAFNRSLSPVRSGALFEKPFKRKLVDDENYFTTLVQYIHQNPERHQFVEDFRLYPYSSYGSMLSTKNTKLERGDVIEWFGGAAQLAKAHEKEPNLAAIQEFLIE